MAQPILIIGDKTPLGGVVMLAAARTVFAGGKVIAAAKDPVLAHPHGSVTVSGTIVAAGTVFVGGLPVARQGHMCGPPCGEPITPASTSRVFVA